MNSNPALPISDAAVLPWPRRTSKVGPPRPPREDHTDRVASRNRHAPAAGASVAGAATAQPRHAAALCAADRALTRLMV